MQIGAKITLFNWAMRERRAQLGMSQVELAALSGVSINTIQRIETLCHPSGDWLTHLQRVANVLEMPMDELFPPEYMESLAAGHLRLRNGRATYILKTEISLEALSKPEDYPLLSANTDFDSELDLEFLKDQLTESLELLEQRRPQQVRVLRLRCGLADGQSYTFEEIGQLLGGISRTRARQLWLEGLSELRRLSTCQALREFEDIWYRE